MTGVIAGLALLTSVFLLVVHYINQCERRHGEIARLRSEALIKLAATQQRITAVQMNLATARVELRRAGDCDDKYDSIEMMPDMMQRTANASDRLAGIRRMMDQLDTTKANKSRVLIGLQSIEHDLRQLDESAGETERKVLDALGLIRSRGGAVGAAPKSQE